MFTRRLSTLGVSIALGALALAAPVGAQTPPGLIHYMPTLHGLGINDAGHGSGKKGGSASSNLAYNGGSIETAPTVYLVFWGSQWNYNDPSGEANLLEQMYSNVGSSSWNNTVTQYCQGAASGATSCGANTAAVGNGPGMLAGVWYDNATAAPTKPTQSQLAAEAVNAAAHFLNTKGSADTTVQYVIATATGNSSSGFGTRYCAWHSSVSSSYGTIAYTNLPYITDAGANCGAGFNNLGPTAGITIVAGHEFAETETDPFPSTGWTDGSGSEIGDKCAWNGATTNVAFAAGVTLPMQPLWSNADKGGTGGCVMSY